MARFTVRDIAARIATCESLDEISRYIQDYPEAIYASAVAHQIMVILPTIEANSEVHELNFDFLYTICNALAKRAALGINEEKPLIDDHSDDSGYMVLFQYYHSLVAFSPKENPFDNATSEERVQQYATKYNMSKQEVRRMMAIGFLFIKFDRWAVSDKRLWKCLQGAGLTEDFCTGFLQTGCPTLDCEMVSSLLSGVMRAIDPIQKRDFSLAYSGESSVEGSFPDWAAAGNLSKMTRVIMDAYIGDLDPEEAEMVRAEAIEGCVQLCNTYTDDWVRWTKILEYALFASPAFDLGQRIDHIMERFELHFGEDTANYIGDIHTICSGSNAGLIPEITQQTTVFLQMERLLYQMMSKHPDVQPEIYPLFVRAVVQLHSDYGARYYDPILITEAMEPVIKDIYEKAHNPVEPGIEAFLDITAAMEAVYEEDPDDGDYSKRDLPDGARDNRKDRDRSKTSKAFQKYLGNKDEVEKRFDGVTGAIKKAYNAGMRTILLKDGKKKTPIGILCKVIGSVMVFNATKVGFLLSIMVKQYMKRVVLPSERRRFIKELDTQIAIVQEKIEDARSEGDKEAKYALMQTLAELKNARDRIGAGRVR